MNVGYDPNERDLDRVLDDVVNGYRFYFLGDLNG